MRGTRQQGQDAGRRSASASVCNRLFEDIQASDNDDSRHGEFITMDGGDLLIDSEVPALTARGLYEVDGVEYQIADDQYLVTFKNGTQALVDLNEMKLAFSSGDSFSDHEINGALVSALAEIGTFDKNAGESLQHLADAKSYYLDNKENPDALRIYAQAAQSVLSEINGEGELEINGKDMYAQFDAPAPRPDILPRAQKRMKFEGAKKRLAKAVAKVGPVKAPLGLLHHMEEDGDVEGPTEEELNRRQEASEKLGLPIPEIKVIVDEEGNSLGDYELGAEEHTNFTSVRNRLSIGQRAFILRGPPGTGKNEFIRQVAALRYAPLVEFNIGPNYSLEDASGSDGLAAVEAKEEVIVRDPKTNEPLKNADGSVVTEMRSAGIASGSVQLEGPLARALKEDCVITINEPEGMENEMVRLHSAFGDEIGNPEGRYLTINSASGDLTLPVHKDCVIFLTYNSGEEDLRFKPALHDRAGNIDFEYLEPEQEAARMAKLVTRAMNSNPREIDAALQREYTAEELLPWVKVMKKAREAPANDPNFVIAPGTRQAAAGYCDILQEGAGEADFPVYTALRMFRYLLPGSEHMSVEERDATLREVFTSDELKKLEAIAEAARKSVQESNESGSVKHVKPKLGK